MIIVQSSAFILVVCRNCNIGFLLMCLVHSTFCSLSVFSYSEGCLVFVCLFVLGFFFSFILVSVCTDEKRDLRYL